MALWWALLYFAAAIVGHALWVRRPRPGHSVVRFVLVGGAAGMALALHLLVRPGPIIEALAALTVYAFACELYIFLFTLAGSSISVQLLLILRGGTLSPERIETMYANAGMVERRLDRLRAAGFLNTAGDVSPKGRRLMTIFLALRHFFLPALQILKDEPRPLGSGTDRSLTVAAPPSVS